MLANWDDPLANGTSPPAPPHRMSFSGDAQPTIELSLEDSLWVLNRADSPTHRASP